MKYAEQSSEKLIQELYKKQAAVTRIEKRLNSKGCRAEMFKEQKEQLRKEINKLRRG